MSVRHATLQPLSADHRPLRACRSYPFGGILSAGEAREITNLVERAAKDVERRKFAATFLDLLFQIADSALTIAGRLAM